MSFEVLFMSFEVRETPKKPYATRTYATPSTYYKSGRQNSRGRLQPLSLRPFVFEKLLRRGSTAA